jgi:hypothetical protein
MSFRVVVPEESWRLMLKLEGTVAISEADQLRVTVPPGLIVATLYVHDEVSETDMRLVESFWNNCTGSFGLANHAFMPTGGFGVTTWSYAVSKLLVAPAFTPNTQSAVYGGTVDNEAVIVALQSVDADSCDEKNVEQTIEAKTTMANKAIVFTLFLLLDSSFKIISSSCLACIT